MPLMQVARWFALRAINHSPAPDTWPGVDSFGTADHVLALVRRQELRRRLSSTSSSRVVFMVNRSIGYSIFVGA
jgi:hypothetical protein